MKTVNSYKNIYALVFIVSFFSTSFFFAQKSEKPNVIVTKQQSSFNLNYKIWDFLHLGQKRLISSILWISTILESDHDHYKKRDLNSWMYLRFNSIAQLEPRFYENYSFGGPYLSIVKDDLPGASDIYKQGLKQYPNDFKLLKDAGFHFYFEVQDYSQSYEIYQKLKLDPKTNIHMLSTLARLETKQGNLDDAYHLLLEKYSELADKQTFLAIKIKGFLYSIKAEKDLECLNNISMKNLKCEVLDFNGAPYVKDKRGQFRAQEKWEKFSIKSKKQAPD